MINHGSFVVSLDFEMMWGMVDCESKDGYGQTNVKQVPEVVERMLKLFSKYDVHATFGTVGMMMYNGTAELLADMPSIKPTYTNSLMSPYENNYIANIQRDEEKLFFCKDLIGRIAQTPNMEIGSHTYCHFYCWEKGQTVEQFDADIAKAKEVASKMGIDIRSVIFPRNNVTDKHLEVLARYGIESYRGNAIKFFDEPKNKIHEMMIRMCRLIDTYINISGNNATDYEEMKEPSGLINVRGSRMLRPYYPRLAFLEGAHISRIKHEIIKAAKNRQMYHLWWHPHNMGADMEKNFKMLEDILKCYKECSDKYQMKSYTMSEMAQYIKENC